MTLESGPNFPFDADADADAEYVLPEILLLLPYGSLADVMGRRFILILNFTGSLCATLWTLMVCKFYYLC